jgi:hypothetical protein
MTPPPPPGPIEKPTSADLFTGTSDKLTKMVPGDASPGYFYAFSPSGITPTVTATMLAAGDAAAPLPATIKYAQRTTIATADYNVVIIGLNFRPDDGMKWRWIDASAYAGVTFWGKVAATSGGTGMATMTMTPVAGNNVATTDARAGACAMPQAMCPSLYGTSVALTSTWKQVKLKWTDFIPSSDASAVPGAPDWKQLARFDFVYVAPTGMTTFDVFFSGFRLATAAELQ